MGRIRNMKIPRGKEEGLCQGGYFPRETGTFRGESGG
jgi:hypothetical protein